MDSSNQESDCSRKLLKAMVAVNPVATPKQRRCLEKERGECSVIFRTFFAAGVTKFKTITTTTSHPLPATANFESLNWKPLFQL